jgi:hypothetical protein
MKYLVWEYSVLLYFGVDIPKYISTEHIKHKNKIGAELFAMGCIIAQAV